MNRNAGAPPNTHTERDMRKASVLVVDDEKNIADTVAMILIAAGYEAKSAYDGSSALSMTREQPPDLMISDVVMPGLNGIELAITIRKEFPSCRVLLFSGQAPSANMLREARGEGYELELLAKPMDPDDLLQKVKEIIGPRDDAPGQPMPG